MAIEPSTGSTGGATPVVLVGSGFSRSSIVAIGGVKTTARFYTQYSGDTVLAVSAPAHAPGSVDVVVTNPDGQSVTVPRGYTYAPPESFRLNGRWGGYGDAGQDIPIEFVFEDGELTSVSCDEYSALTFSPPLKVEKGEFAFARSDGVSVTGRITSASTAAGTINLAPCDNTNWFAGPL
ncbi:MAG: IPT/TIG domain-containing protein [Gemmatimonadaceae bacterium]